MSKYDPLYLKQYSPKQGKFNGHTIKKIINKLYTRYEYSYFGYNELLSVIQTYVKIPSKKETEFINDLRRLQVLEIYKAENNDYSLVSLFQRGKKNYYYKLTPNIELFNKDNDPDKSLYYSYLHHPIVSQYVKEIYNYKRVSIDRAFSILLNIIQRFEELRDIINLYINGGLDKFKRQFLGKIAYMGGEILLKKQHGNIIVEINIGEKTINYITKIYSTSIINIHEFYNEVKQTYISIVRKIGLFKEYIKGGSIPIPIGSIYDEYIRTYNKKITLEQFFDNLKKLSRTLKEIIIGYHPVYYNDIRQWYIIIKS